MLSYTIRRLLVAIPTIFLLVVACFYMMHFAPGGPFTSERPLPPAVMANIEARYGLDQPLWKQLWDYLVNIFVHFDFGPSFKFKDRDVNDIIAQGFPISLTYGFLSFIVASAIGVALGVTAAIKHNSWIDYFAVSLGIAAQALPNFIMGPILILTFTLWLEWLPGGGWNGGQWQYLVMPVIALSTSYMGSISRITRSSMLEVLNSNFIRTAKAKGLSNRAIIWRHALKPTLMPVVSYLGPVFVYVLTGSVFVDIYFSTGGLGQAYVGSALSRDYAVLLGVTILYGALTVVVNLITDLAYAWLDPKIRY
ncbi:MAG: oligopeptide ABC transporter permease OppB [Pseudomonadota bacterium]|jgi:oligopeptide transport system permease protein|uniref:Oligopeptide transport system permease protein OppB n=1 Tax=Thalassovita autumnalis TaxID=2072972 RepID=A0A0N7LXC8_9RHOB|nr:MULTISPECIES: oligopeptide ABC transporter permease OppB [Thalassovita]MEC7962238.1 oligopeptide ABC transporter permease OppB [Pseudomonadota bacterium]MEC8040572.1 oligopeptide ABC transporter permease OppB [Pseudomonadota bacterium]MEC8294532.1 oligopeptide ABC transporter permease OppB [Pseudomonadota bacterium]CUH66872.1 Oligopeptide transport system permease protein OppB [Thalassovita autumnalis]CUH71543.1 Oligopeptide transport system permease protein OppB [Thalassovita autumnalis]|tara:strand:+ start:1016 stop:1939 length:924 start_codon:yes stop_codon:yes gene_type:complete